MPGWTAGSHSPPPMACCRRTPWCSPPAPTSARTARPEPPRCRPASSRSTPRATQTRPRYRPGRYWWWAAVRQGVNSPRSCARLVNRRSWPSRLELQSAVFEYIEAFYNRQRRHSTLGMLSPSPTNNYDSPRSVVENNRSNNNNQQQHRKDQGVTQTGAGPLADYCFDRRVSTEAAGTNVREAASLGAKRTSRGDETPTRAGATAIGRGHRLEPRGILGISGPSSSARSHRHTIVRSSPRLRLLRALSLATAA